MFVKCISYFILARPGVARAYPSLAGSDLTRSATEILVENRNVETWISLLLYLLCRFKFYVRHTLERKISCKNQPLKIKHVFSQEQVVFHIQTIFIVVIFPTKKENIYFCIKITFFTIRSGIFIIPELYYF